MAFKDEIRRNRKRLGLTTKSFAHLMNVGRATVCRWESGQYEPTVQKLISMAKFFGLTETELLHPSEDRKEEMSNNLKDP